jgi:hypothetical protein
MPSLNNYSTPNGASIHCHSSSQQNQRIHSNLKTKLKKPLIANNTKNYKFLNDNKNNTN